MNKKKFLYYAFSCIEAAALLLFFVFEPRLLELSFEEALKVYHILALSIFAIEIIYLVMVIRKKRGYLGLPITILIVYRTNILEIISTQPVSFTIGTIVLFRFIILIRILESLYLYKNRSASDDFFSYKSIISSLTVDFAALFQHLLFYVTFKS